jgi:hypothetical protein
MADIKKCEKCEYWSGANGGHSFSFCHHLLWTDKRRVEVDGVCRSFEPRRKGKKRGRTEEVPFLWR